MLLIKLAITIVWIMGIIFAGALSGLIPDDHPKALDAVTIAAAIPAPVIVCMWFFG